MSKIAIGDNANVAGIVGKHEGAPFADPGPEQDAADPACHAEERKRGDRGGQSRREFGFAQQLEWKGPAANERGRACR